MPKDYLRGYLIICKDGEWLYEDTLTPTVGNERSCGYCGKSNTKDGHDGCISNLPNVMNACCGHGQVEYSYIQYLDRSSLHGKQAALVIAENVINRSRG